MKNRRLTYLGTMVLGILILSLLALSGCSGQQSPASTPTPANTQVPMFTQTSPPPPSSSVPQPQATKTLKIGIVALFSSTTSMDAMRSIELMADIDNKNGGWDIGGEKYKIELIEYDNNNSQATEVAATNRLVFEDKVKYIITQGTYQDGWEKVTEDNKVIVSTWAPMKGLDPKLHYMFAQVFGNTQAAAVTGWFCKNYPQLANGIALVLPDNVMGHVVYTMLEPTWKAFDVTPQAEFFPANQQDLSSLGTKIATINPTAVSALTGSDVGDGLIYNTIYNAGYKGQFYTSSFMTEETLSQVMSPQALEGFICGALPTEFDPPLSQLAKEFKDAWIAKYGKWTGPNILYLSSYFAFKTALQTAGTTDTDKVAEVISSGMKYSTPVGTAQMISRPDFQNERTVDSVSEVYIKQMNNGKAKLVATISLDEALTYANKVLSLGPPPGPPPGGPPPGGPPPEGGLPPGGPPPGGLPPGGLPPPPG
jgi:branched-chain amino acid transport system substrate-binding protein